MNSFSQRLLAARKMAGLSLQQLADKLDIDFVPRQLTFPQIA